MDPILARKYDLLLDSGVTLRDITLGAVDPGCELKRYRMGLNGSRFSELTELL